MLPSLRGQGGADNAQNDGKEQRMSDRTVHSRLRDLILIRLMEMASCGESEYKYGPHFSTPAGNLALLLMQCSLEFLLPLVAALSYNSR